MLESRYPVQLTHTDRSVPRHHNPELFKGGPQAHIPVPKFQLPRLPTWISYSCNRGSVEFSKCSIKQPKFKCKLVSQQQHSSKSMLTSCEQAQEGEGRHWEVAVLSGRPPALLSSCSEEAAETEVDLPAHQFSLDVCPDDAKMVWEVLLLIWQGFRGRARWLSSRS